MDSFALAIDNGGQIGWHEIPYVKQPLTVGDVPWLANPEVSIAARDTAEFVIVDSDGRLIWLRGFTEPLSLVSGPEGSPLFKPIQGLTSSDVYSWDVFTKPRVYPSPVRSSEAQVGPEPAIQDLGPEY
jgi:hypothetical protein